MQVNSGFRFSIRYTNVFYFSLLESCLGDVCLMFWMEQGYVVPGDQFLWHPVLSDAVKPSRLVFQIDPPVVGKSWFRKNRPCELLCRAIIEQNPLLTTSSSAGNELDIGCYAFLHSRTCPAYEGFTETKRQRSTGRHPRTKSAFCPAEKPVINSWSTACFVLPSVPGYALHEKGIQRQKRRRSIDRQPGTKSASRPCDKPVINR